MSRAGFARVSRQITENHAACTNAVIARLSSPMLTPQAQFWPRKAVPITTDATAPKVSTTNNVRIEKRGNSITVALENAVLFLL